jgi:hypothetical protein
MWYLGEFHSGRLGVVKALPCWTSWAQESEVEVDLILHGPQLNMIKSDQRLYTSTFVLLCMLMQRFSTLQLFTVFLAAEETLVGSLFW